MYTRFKPALAGSILVLSSVLGGQTSALGGENISAAGIQSQKAGVSCLTTIDSEFDRMLQDWSKPCNDDLRGLRHTLGIRMALSRWDKAKLAWDQQSRKMESDLEEMSEGLLANTHKDLDALRAGSSALPATQKAKILDAVNQYVQQLREGENLLANSQGKKTPYYVWERYPSPYDLTVRPSKVQGCPNYQPAP
ncbi:hypothetical protein JDN40_03890 [Rhodomicrobium vannielii ATCC 17100]|uniref:hypothetical protein n=1 Tax=Rhodomicrobium vannielii TaxID=1069 RepID=UPI001918AE37|nr:hypothetical protein [Rhodomicrobium vannielii]MBJ7533247.1 hypothetical protein [Rhodomicrobium vannielii ATCC 17100]